jgi:hypothetical protein
LSVLPSQLQMKLFSSNHGVLCLWVLDRDVIFYLECFYFIYLNSTKVRGIHILLSDQSSRC